MASTLTLPVDQSTCTLIAGGGGAGNNTLAYIMAGYLEREGRVPDGIAFLGIDVMTGPPVVPAHLDGRTELVSLELTVEYIQIGKDLDPPHLSAVLRRNRRVRPMLQWLLDRQTGGRYAKGLDRGCEAERAYALLAYYWSEDEIERAVEAALLKLSSAHTQGGLDAAPGRAINMVYAGSEAGAVGSTLALPFAGLVKRSMRRLGMSPHRSLFTYLAIGPEAFPLARLRASNSYETLTEVAIAQKEGIIP